MLVAAVIAALLPFSFTPHGRNVPRASPQRRLNRTRGLHGTKNLLSAPFLHSPLPSGNVTNIHDPSGIVIGDDGTPLVFSTSRSPAGAINVHAARNSSGSPWMFHQWHWIGFAFPTEELPAWVEEKVPNNEGQGVWAPDVTRISGTWHLYFAISSFGSQRSCIGHATAERLTADAGAVNWTQHPPVICSGQLGDPPVPYNALDPHVLQDDNGDVWMSFGSFFGGIYVTRLDSGGYTAVGSPVQVAARADPTTDPSIEASWIELRQSSYWLFVNWVSRCNRRVLRANAHLRSFWDATRRPAPSKLSNPRASANLTRLSHTQQGYCCRGSASTYNIRVGRSTQITGPFIDRNGTPMLRGGGTLVQGTGGPVVGPGQVGIYTPSAGAMFDPVVTEHYYNKSNGGVPTLNVLALNNDAFGWPYFY